MMKELMGLRLISGLDDIDRWHSKPSSITDRVGHHSRRVETIAILLVAIFNGRPNEAIVRPLVVMLYAKIHDLAEFYTGDFMGYLKTNHPSSFGKTSKELESKVLPLFISELPEFFQTTIADINELELQFVKLADKIDALFHYRAEIRNGQSTEYEPIANDHEESIAKFTELQWVVNLFFQQYGGAMDLSTSEVFGTMNLASLE